MISMHRIAAIGDKDSILGFKALGISIFPASDKKEAKDCLQEARERDHAIIFITEPLLEEIEPLINEMNRELLPAIIPIPNNQGSTGKARERMRKMVEKAVGVDILFEKEGDN